MKFSCSICCKRYRVDDVAAGRLFTCLICKTKLRLPAAKPPVCRPAVDSPLHGVSKVLAR